MVQSMSDAVFNEIRNLLLIGAFLGFLSVAVGIDLTQAVSERDTKYSNSILFLCICLCTLGFEINNSWASDIDTTYQRTALNVLVRIWLDLLVIASATTAMSFTITFTGQARNGADTVFVKNIMDHSFYWVASFLKGIGVYSEVRFGVNILMLILTFVNHL